MFAGDTSRDRLYVYPAADEGDWRWRRVAGNRRTISSGEGFTRKRDAVRAGERANPGLEAQVLEVAPAAA